MPFSNQHDVSPYSRTLSICLTLSIVVVGIVALYAFGRIFQVFIGEEIVIEQKVIIETQVKLSDLLKEGDDENDEDDGNNNKNEITTKSGGRRSKKLKDN